MYPAEMTVLTPKSIIVIPEMARGVTGKQNGTVNSKKYYDLFMVRKLFLPELLAAVLHEEVPGWNNLLCVCLFLNFIILYCRKV